MNISRPVSLFPSVSYAFSMICQRCPIASLNKQIKSIKEPRPKSCCNIMKGGCVCPFRGLEDCTALASLCPSAFLPWSNTYLWFCSHAFLRYICNSSFFLVVPSAYSVHPSFSVFPFVCLLIWKAVPQLALCFRLTLSLSAVSHHTAQHRNHVLV